MEYWSMFHVRPVFLTKLRVHYLRSDRQNNLVKNYVLFLISCIYPLSSVVPVLERTDLRSKYDAFPAAESAINSTWYSSQLYGISFDECVSGCIQSIVCTGFHYDPNLQGCGYLNYTQSYAAKSRGAGEVLFYLLEIDTTIARGEF